MTKTSTWKFSAENVRDFAFATSRKFIWDAQGVQIGDKRPLAMSFYPKEGNPLWEEYSTDAVVKTLETYSKYTIDYPLPGGDIGARCQHWNGVPHDLFQLWSTQERWLILRPGKVWDDRSNHSRGRSQLFPHDHKLRRKAMDLDGRRVEFISANIEPKWNSMNTFLTNGALLPV